MFVNMCGHVCVCVCVHAFMYVCSSINGVKDMVGYRKTLNLSYDLDDRGGGGNSSQSCSFEDDVETSAILVSTRCN